MVMRLFRGLLAVAAGAVVYLWATPSFIAAIVVAWYVWESIPVYAAALRRRQGAWACAAPRAVGTVAALGLAYLVFFPWEQVIALAYPLFLILEGLYRLLLRRVCPAVHDQARWTVAATRGPPGTERSLLWRGIPSLLCASLLVTVLPPTITFYGLRQVALDVRFYVAGFEKWEVYDPIARLAGDVAIDAAADAMRKPSSQVWRVLQTLTEEDKAIAARTLLPAPWTGAVVEQALDATLSWLQRPYRAKDVRQRVPSISLPVHDVKRHLQETISVLLDRHVAALPACASGTSSSTSCRPADMSAVAYTATHKPEALAAVDEAFALVPAELDLSTAVTLFPRAFQRPLTLLDQVRGGVRGVDRVLGWIGAGCLLAWVCLWLFSSVSLRAALCWTGMTLLVVAGRAWLYSWAVLTWPRALAGSSLLEGLPNGLPDGLADLPIQALSDLTHSVHALLWPWVLAMAGTGLLVAVVACIWPAARSPRAAESRSARVLVVVLAVGFLLWRVYLDAGHKLYNRAYTAHRQGDVARAMAGYRKVEQWYPFAVDPFIERARQGMRECRRYQAAEAAYRAGAYESAVQAYEALLVGNPTMALRNAAQAHLVDALYRWAESMRQAGAYERALERYRFLRDGLEDRDVQPAIADLYTAWGEALRQKGDYGAAIAAYRRIAYDVFSPRLWADADGQIANAYCEWSRALRTGGHDEQADHVCEEFGKTLSPAEVRSCAACATH